MKSKTIIVIGAGASGIMAAISASENGANVILVEQKESIGKKILVTGNGRCNLTNEEMHSSCYHSNDRKLIKEVLATSISHSIKEWFISHGVLLKERNGYIYPLTNQASTVLDVLKMELKHQKVNILTSTCVKQIEQKDDVFLLKHLEGTLRGDAVILATGGKAYPVLGSDGGGYDLAKRFGHKMSSIVPSLVALPCTEPFFKRLSGVRSYCTVKALVEGALIASDTGELQWTNSGISGIPVFQISRHINFAILNNKSVSISIDLLPDIDQKQLFDFIKKRILIQGHMNLEEFLIGIFHKKLIPVLLDVVSLDSRRIASSLSTDDIHKLNQTIKQFLVSIKTIPSFEQAQVCAGGVLTKEIEPSSMMSTLVKNLYITGELLDVDGICGGYNLHFAFVTGNIAGKHAAKENKTYDSN